MALLGKFVDVSAVGVFSSGYGTAGPGHANAYATVIHSLGTTPDKVDVMVVSVGAHTRAPPQVWGIGGNATVSTVMLAASTLPPGAVNGSVAYKVISVSLYTLIR